MTFKNLRQGERFWYKGKIYLKTEGMEAMHYRKGCYFKVTVNAVDVSTGKGTSFKPKSRVLETTVDWDDLGL